MKIARQVTLSTVAAALLAVAVAGPAPTAAAQALPKPPEHFKRDQAKAPAREMDRSRTAFVYLPADGEIRISYQARWDNAVVVYRPRAGQAGGWEEVARSVREPKKVALKAGAYIVTAWSNRGKTEGGDQAWQQDQYRVTGSAQGFVVGFNDGREPNFDDARVDFVWPGARGTVGAATAPGTSGAAQPTTDAEARYPKSGPGGGLPSGPFGTGQGPQEGPSPEKGAR